MRVDSLRVENFKKYEYYEQQFEGNFTLIIGDNGAGKTSILEAICASLGEYLVGIDGVKPKRSFKNEEIRFSYKTIGQGSIHFSPSLPIEVEMYGSIFNTPMNWTRYKEFIDGRTKRTGDDVAGLARHKQTLINNDKSSEIVLPLISYQSAGRLFSQKREKWVNPFNDERTSRFVGYYGCLEEESDMKLMTHWFRRMKGLQMQSNATIGEYQSVINAINTFMTVMEGPNWGGIDFDFNLEEIMICKDDTWLPIRMFSAGYRGLIGMVTDLAYRTAVLNPQLLERATALTPGIVLIDELDLHLHPKWQWRVIEALTKTYPMVQFIATTHAPILIASCMSGQVIDLNNYINSSDESPYGWRIEDVLDKMMGTFIRSPEIEQDINSLRKLYSKKLNNELANEEHELLLTLSNKLNSILPESDPIITLTKLEAIRQDIQRNSP